MPQNDNGGSANSNSEVMFEASFPKDGGGTVKATNDEKPVDQQQQHVQPADDKSSQQTEPKADETGKNSQTDGVKKDANSMSSAEQELHNQKLDFIESVMKQGNDQAKQFFQENPEYATIANRSKRLKDSYRNLFEPNADAQQQQQVQQPQQQTPKTDTTDNNQDVDSVADKAYLRIIEKQEKSMQSSEARAFAEKNGLNADDVDALLETAQKIKASVPSQSFAQCLQGANVALYGNSGNAKSVTTPSGQGTDGGDTGNAEAPDKDTEIARLMSKHDVDKATAEKFYKQQYGNSQAKGNFTGQLGETFQVKR